MEVWCISTKKFRWYMCVCTHEVETATYSIYIPFSSIPTEVHVLLLLRNKRWDRRKRKKAHYRYQKGLIDRRIVLSLLSPL